MNFTRAASLLTATAMTVTALSACGGDSEPAPSTSTASPIDRGTDSPSESSSGSETSGSDKVAELPDSIPVDATEKSKQGAAAFGKYYYLTFGEANHTGDTSTLEMLELSDCDVCETSAENIREDAAKGWTRSENAYTVRNVRATKRPDRGFKVSMEVRVAKHYRVDADGDPNATIKATTYTLTEHVVWVDGRWQIADWVIT